MVAPAPEKAEEDTGGESTIPKKRKPATGWGVTKYKAYSTGEAPHQDDKKYPSEALAEALAPERPEDTFRPRPRIVETLNLGFFTHQVECAVDTDEPIFQPFPPEVAFRHCQPHQTHEAKLFLRNNDKVPRRVKVIPPNSPYFSIRREPGPLSNENNKVAMGMEVVYTIAFKPDLAQDAQYELLVCTEREKFIVPIVVRGSCAILDLPDQLNFPSTAVKESCQQAVLMTNKGDAETSFTIEAAPPFQTRPSQGMLGVGEALLCSVEFTPRAVGEQQGEMVIRCDDGRRLRCGLTGSSHEAEVYLSQDEVEMLPTYVTKMSQRSFRIVNATQEPKAFSIHTLDTPDAEEAAKLEALAALEGEEREADSPEEGPEDEDGILTRSVQSRARQLALRQQGIRSAGTLFEHSNFVMDTREGVVPAMSEMEIVVQFRPDFAHDYLVTAFVEVQGREARLPMALKAKGLGPQGTFTYDMLDVGHPFIHTPHQYEVELQNRGEIDLEFCVLEEQTEHESKFSFEPSSGTIPPGGVQKIQAGLLSDLLGCFDQTYNWQIKGSSKVLQLQFKGCIVGPEFEVDIDRLDLGLVAYGFRYSKHFTLSNPSKIPLRFRWHVERDNQEQKQFQIVPGRGTILPHGRQVITVEFIGRLVQNYKLDLIMDIPAVEDDVLRLPFTAECAVPKLSVHEALIDFGDCFLRHPYKREIKIVNESKLPAKFKVMEQDAASRSLAQLVTEPLSGGIPAQGEQVLDLELSTIRLGRIQLPLRIVTEGSLSLPLELLVAARSIGPILTFGSAPGKVAAQPEVQFGSVTVLEEHTRLLHVHNPSDIPAKFSTFLEGKDSVFVVDTASSVLEAGASMQLAVSVWLDETKLFKDTLHVMIFEGEDVPIPLSATGKGQLVVSDELTGVEVLDFGDQLVKRPFSRQVTLCNCGRQVMTLQWTNLYAEQARKMISKAKKAGGAKGKNPLDALPDSDKVVFSITPERLVLEPKASASFVVEGTSPRTGVIQEHFRCLGAVGNSRSQATVFDVTMQSLLATPLLEFSDKVMCFQYVHKAEESPALIELPLTLRNISKVRLSVTLSTTAPFSISSAAHELEPRESSTLFVAFNPACKADLQSRSLKGAVTVAYSDNPHVDMVQLVADVRYPNLQLSKTKMDFGTVLIDTTEKATLELRNTSTLEASFSWAFQAYDPPARTSEDDAGRAGRDKPDSKEGDAASSPKPRQRQQKAALLQPNLMFDVTPVTGVLPPGESRTVTFSYFAFPGQRPSVKALCQVDQGPTYEVALSAESNSIKYQLEPQVVDCGATLMDKQVERELVVHNQGKVPFPLVINTTKQSRKGFISIAPASSTVEAGQKLHVQLLVKPGVPDLVEETIYAHIAHFQPVPITVRAKGVAPLVSLSLPPHPGFQEFLDAAAAKLQEAGACETAGKPGRASPKKRAPPKAAETAELEGEQGPEAVPEQAGPAPDAAAPPAAAAGGSPALGAADAHAVRLEGEARRLQLLHLLELKREQEQAIAVEVKPAVAEAPPAAEEIKKPAEAPAGGSDEAAKPAEPGLALRKSVTRVRRVPLVNSGQYMVDLGQVVKGTVKSKKFSMQNVGSQPVSFNVDKRQLDALGLTLEPGKVQKLPCGPEQGSMELVLSLNSASRRVAIGNFEAIVPLMIRSAPPIMLQISACVSTPDLVFSSTQLDFGEVQTGHCRIMTVQLHNPKQVPCEWAVKKPLEGGKVKDWEFFQCEPAEGVLQPNEHFNIRVRFTPVHGRESPYELAIPIKVKMGQRAFSLNCTGCGYTLRLAVDSSAVEVGAILPSCEGQQPISTEFALCNPGRYPIEVFSLDFDERYLRDEQLLRECERYNAQDIMLLPPLPPGAPLWPEVVEEVERKREMQRAAEEAERAAAEAAAEGEGADNEAAAAAPAPDARNADEVGELEVPLAQEAAPAEEPVPAPVRVVLYGPDLGCELLMQQAEMLAARYKLPIMTLDDLILDAGELEEEPQPAPIYEPPPSPPPSGKGKRDKHAAPPPPTVPADPENFGDMLYEHLIGYLPGPGLDLEEAEALQQEPPPRPFKALPPPLLEYLTARALRAALLQPRFERGFVLAGLQCEYVSPETAASCLCKALGLGKQEVSGSEEVLPAAGGASPESSRFLWAGQHALHMVQLRLSPAQLLASYRAKHGEPEIDAADAAAVEGAEEPEAVPGTGGMEEEGGNGQGQAEPEDPDKWMTEMDQDSQDSLRRYRDEAAALQLVFGEADAQNRVIARTLEVGEDPDAEILQRQVCGLSFVLGEIQHLLPPVAGDELIVPEPYTLQIVRRPPERTIRKPIRDFVMIAPSPPDAPPPAVEELPPEPPKVKGKGGKKDAKPAPEPEVVEEEPKQTRWVLAPGEKMQATVQFQSEQLGSQSELLGFQVMQGPKEVAVLASATCSFPQISTDPRSVFYRKVKHRPRTPRLSCVYVASSGKFEFGPLLVGRDPQVVLAPDAEAVPGCTGYMRITNSGRFPVKAAFFLKSQGVPEAFPEQLPEPADPKKGGGKAGGKGGGKGSGRKGKDAGQDAAPKQAFWLSPATMELGLDETQDLKLVALPHEVGEVEDAVVCLIKDNPTPVEFAVCCIGQKPALEVSLKLAAAGGEEGAEPAKPPEEGVQFQRSLLGRQLATTLLFTNMAAVSALYQLKDPKQLPPELTITPNQGELAARGSEEVVLQFLAQEPKQVAYTAVVEVLDTQDLLGVVQELRIPISGEGYRMDVDLTYPTPDFQGLDFGALKTSESAMLPLTISNTGKYEVGYRMEFSRAALRQLFNIVPAEGTIPPGGKAEVEVHFNRHLGIRKEINLVGNMDLKLSVIETLTGAPEQLIPIPINVRTVFMKYAVTPARGLNFGPHIYNTSSRPSMIELCNVGEFPFQFALFDYGSGERMENQPRPPSQESTGSKKDKAVAGKKGGKPDAPPSLSLGPFAVVPPSGTVEPGATVQLQVTFHAKAAKVCSETLGIHVQDRDFQDNPGGLAYPLTAESCVPGIDTTNWNAIFEEHTISTSLDHFCAVSNEFSTRERVFNFGTVIADLAAEGDEAGGVAVGDEAESRGVTANLKITNPVRVPCTIDLSITPLGQAAGEGFPISVAPAQLVIPPVEFRFVSVSFHPRSLGCYRGTFKAAVQNGEANDATRMLTFEVRGDGVLPSISLELPREVEPGTGRQLLAFPRLLTAKAARRDVLLRNNGKIPVAGTVLFAPGNGFVQVDGASVFQLEPNKAHKMEVEFRPLEVGEHKNEMVIEVRDNPFERYCIAMKGGCFVQDVVLDGLPDDSADMLTLQDCHIGGERHASFQLVSHSSQHFRFAWPTVPHVTFRPARGHLHAGCSKQVQLTFCPTAAVRMAPEALTLKCEAIEYKGEAQHWDSSMVTMSYPEASPDQGDAADGEAVPEPVGVPEPEPAVNVVKGGDKAVTLKLHAVADNASYDCETTPIHFRPTMMFQTRSYTFTLANSSGASLAFAWRFLLPDGSPDPSELYSVSPESGSIEAGQSVEVTVRFSPLEVVDCQRLLVADIPHLQEELQPLQRLVNGKVQRPWCHFDLADSDYISAGRRNPELPGPSGDLSVLDAGTRVIEFASLGTKLRNTKRFFVLNPTSISYDFFWERVGPPPAAGGADATEVFSCGTRRGVISGGRKYEMSFEYAPVADELLESFWTFSIPEHRITVPFLLVGTVTEPRVMFSVPAINFGKVLVGGRIKQQLSIINLEHVPFQFALDAASYDATENAADGLERRRKPILSFTPTSGTVQPNSKVDITATFSPNMERLVNYNVICNVRKKPTCLSLNAKGEGYCLHDSMHLEGADGSAVPLDGDHPHSIVFGQVLVNERSTKVLSMLNSGDLPFDFSWDLGSNPRVSVSPETGTVSGGMRVPCELSYTPHRPDLLDNYEIRCKVHNGSTYVLRLSGRGHRPKLDCSFYDHDFGRCFLYGSGMPGVLKTLRVRNDDTQEVTIDSAFAGLPWLDVSLSSTVLQPGQSQEVPFTFLPQAEEVYRTVVPIEVNGLYNININIAGQGCKLKLELADAGQRTVKFGPLHPGQMAMRTLRLVNRSRIPAPVSLEPSGQRLRTASVEMLPERELTLPSGEAGEITFTFRPPVRKPVFFEDVVVSVLGMVLPPLATLTGACLGTEVRLSADSLPFGAVVQGSRTSKRLQLENTGDVGTRFAWSTGMLGPHFSIFPADGFLAPGQDVKLDITFHPQLIDPDITAEAVRCQIEGGDDCFLSLSGACTNTEAQPEVLQFRCRLRQSTTKTITLSNPGTASWQIKPSIQNDAWTGPEFITVKGGSKGDYTLTFSPLSATADGQPHTGSVFFPIPDGSGMLYALEGIAESPEAEGNIQVDVVARQPITHVLNVSNWLSRPQRFAVKIEQPQAAAATRLTAVQHLDVPALATKPCKLNFVTHVAGSTKAVVTFLNETSGEFLFFNLTFVAGPPEIAGSLSLECPVRTRTTQSVIVDNPLDVEVPMTISCTHPQVFVEPSLTLPSGVATTVPFTFQPLLVAESEASLMLQTQPLGTIEYKLALKGVDTVAERPLSFSVGLGSSETKVFRFTHWAPARTEYQCSFKSQAPFFQCTPKLTVDAPADSRSGAEATVEVTFEPTATGGNFRDTLVVHSSTGGEYLCPLVGTCVPPTPAGPIVCGSKGGSVPLKNVFAKDAEFLLTCDNPCFSVKPSEKIGAKKQANIGVAFKADGTSSRTGKLTVACPAMTESNWVFYLKAEEGA